MSARPEIADAGPRDPQPEGEPCIRITDLLTFVLTEAGARDSRHAHLYDRMDAARVREAATLAQQLLVTHLTLMGRWGRQARTGKKAHRDAVYGLLRGSNEAALVLAASFLEVALVVFAEEPASEP